MKKMLNNYYKKMRNISKGIMFLFLCFFVGAGFLNAFLFIDSNFENYSAIISATLSAFSAITLLKALAPGLVRMKFNSTTVNNRSVKALWDSGVKALSVCFPTVLMLTILSVLLFLVIEY